MSDSGPAPLVDPLSPEGLHDLLTSLPEPTDAERELIDLVVQVDLTSRNGSKWRGVAAALGALIGHATPTVPAAGGGGMATYANRNQFSNRMRQAGVAGVDTTVFVFGDPALLRLSVSELTAMMALTTTVTRHALVMYRSEGTCRVVRLLAVAPGTDEVTELLRGIAPAAPLQLVQGQEDTPRTAEDAAAPEDAVATDTGPGGAPRIVEPARVWFVTDAGEGGSEYANVDGNSYQYKRATRAGRDEVAAGHWLLIYRLVSVDSPEAGHIYGVARIHKVHKYGDVRYAIFDRYLRLDPALALSAIGGDPRLGAQIAITEIDVARLETVLAHAGVTHADQLPVPAMRLGVKDVEDRLGAVKLPAGVVEQCVAALRGGKHLILLGPPGTGKSTLAIAIGEAANDVGLSRHRPIVTTGTSDWTSTDTVGGYRLDPALGVNGLVFQSGFMLEAVDTDSWLVIDELNRADIDKAIGQFFSVLSGQPALLPYVDADGARLGVSVPGGDEEIGPYAVTEQWRLVTTMNERDRDLLFNLSEALLRRFAVVTVPAPVQPADWDWVLRHRAHVAHPVLAQRLKSLTRLKRPRLGPAIVIDCAKYMTQQVAMAIEAGREVDVTSVVSGALDTLVRPQLASLFGEDLRLAERGLEQVVAGTADVGGADASGTPVAGDPGGADATIDGVAGDDPADDPSSPESPAQAEFLDADDGPTTVPDDATPAAGTLPPPDPS